MALPPSMVAPGLDLDDTAGLPDLEIPIDVPMEFPNGAEIMDDGVGGAIVQALGLAPEMLGPEPMYDHTMNLAEALSDSELGELSTDLRGLYDEDLDSRSEWEEAYTKGLDLLGLKYEERTVPFEGASGITNPMISESVTQFQAQAYKEMLPSGGPVKTKVVGLRDLGTDEQAARVKDFMNYQITEVMEEFDPDTDQMLFYLPLSGSTFKKVYYDETKQRAVSKFVPAQDLVVPYSASDLATATRVTHVLRMDENEIRKLQLMGFYRDVELKGSEDLEEDPVRQKVNELEGISKNYSDDVHTVLEMHVDLDLEGFEDVSETGEPTGLKLPYVVTIDHDSGEVLSIRRNYAEDDPTSRKRQYFVHYKFMPGLGFYGFGLIHMIGGLGRAATSILRQLIDAGTLANLPAGFKARGVRVRNDDEPLQPGEWRDIDAPGGSIREAIIPLPYKEPSATLGQLLGAIQDQGRRFISTADQLSEQGSQEMPVGTTMALMERGTKVMSAIHKRLHYAQKTEFRLLARIFSENLPPEYPYDVSGASRQIKAEDFDDRVDVIPVSDPNIFSMAQRVSLAQSQLQLAQANPEIHNIYQAYRRMYQALEIQNIDEILPPPPEPQPTDPVLENAQLLGGQLPQSFPDQNHEAHIQVHVTFLQMPIAQGNPQVSATLVGHIFEHVGMQARQMVQAQVEQQMQEQMQQLELAVQTGAISTQMAQQQIMQIQQMAPPPEQIEAQIAQMETQLMQQVMMMIQPPMPPMPDPLVQIRQQELAIKQQQVASDAQLDQMKLQLEQAKMAQQATADSARLELQEQIADDRNEVNRDRINVQREAMIRRTQ